MKKYYFVIFLFLGFFNQSQAQLIVSELSPRVHKNQLESGKLFVLLPNSDKKIKRLKELKLDHLIEVEKEEIAKARKDIVEGFKEYFSFCDVLFYEMKHSGEVLNGNYENVFDYDLKKLEKLPNSKYNYIVRFGEMNPAGEVSRYNGRGFQIKYINNGDLEGIKSDSFFSGYVPAKVIRFPKNAIHYRINKLNRKLKSYRN